MYRIVKKEALKPTVILYEIEAPMVAKKAEPGQFIILRVDENGERIPITIHDYDREKGTVTIIVQTVGATTEKLSHKQQGDYLHDFVGPLGKPTETEGKKKVCVVGGGVGCAIAYPVAKAMHEAGAVVDGIMGFRNKDIVILEKEFNEACDNFYMMTDDGSYGEKGFVTNHSILNSEQFDSVSTCGPKPMMMAVARWAAAANVPCEASLENLMACGLGACLCCVEKMADGHNLCVCKEGPVFNTNQLSWLN